VLLLTAKIFNRAKIVHFNWHCLKGSLR